MKTGEKFELYKPKKFLGQNFLVDDNIARKIIRSLTVVNGESIVEIGPGRGALTKHLTGISDNITAVEYDRKVFEHLEAEFEGKVKFVHCDFLDYDLKSHDASGRRTVNVIGNIPYNITSKILFKLFEDHASINMAVLMMQKEVALRLTAKPSTKDYGILAVQTQVHCKPELLFDVPPSAFFPKPTVKSTVVRLNFMSGALVNEIRNYNMFREVVRESFGQRRKIMSNSLRQFMERKNLKPDEIGFDFSRRPEMLSPEEFIGLANMFNEASKEEISTADFKETL